MLRQGDAQAFNKYSQRKLQMKREALEKLQNGGPLLRTVGPLCEALDIALYLG
jgi:hypothetical protein